MTTLTPEQMIPWFVAFVWIQGWLGMWLALRTCKPNNGTVANFLLPVFIWPFLLVLILIIAAYKKS